MIATIPIVTMVTPSTQKLQFCMVSNFSKLRYPHLSSIEVEMVSFSVVWLFMSTAIKDLKVTEEEKKGLKGRERRLRQRWEEKKAPEKKTALTILQFDDLKWNFLSDLAWSIILLSGLLQSSYENLKSKIWKKSTSIWTWSDIFDVCFVVKYEISFDVFDIGIFVLGLSLEIGLNNKKIFLQK